MTRRTRYLVHPLVHRISKFLPRNPPERHDRVYVDDLGPCRVVRDPKLTWDGLTWTLCGPILVEPLASSTGKDEE